MNASVEVNEFYDGSLLLRPFTEVTGLAIDQVSDAKVRNVSDENRDVLSMEDGNRRRSGMGGREPSVCVCVCVLFIVTNVQALT